MLLAGGVAAYVANGLDGDILRLAGWFTALALLALVAAIVGWWAAGAWTAQAILGVLYLVVVSLRGPEVDTSAPAVAAGLLLSGELAVLSRALLDGLLLDPRELARRLLVLATLGVGSVAVGWLLLAVSIAALPGGMVTTALGAAAAVGSIGVVLAVAREAR
jgi:hypothetical protein